LLEFLDYLKNEGLLHQTGSSYYWMADQYPAQAVSLRSASPSNVILQVESDPPAVIGQVDQASAAWMVHPQAVYLHEGQSYLVDDLDLQGNIAHLRRLDTDYYTEHRSQTQVDLLETYASQPVSGGQRSYGEIKVTTQVIGYRKVRWYTHEVLGVEDLELPPSELLTMGYWLGLADEAVDVLRQQGMWTNDSNQYGPAWPRLRELVRQRDGYRCQVCGQPEQGRAHDVHHKTPFRLFASPELANSLDNLLTLCPSCHRRVELGVRVRSGLAGLGYILSRLAPLFLMCDPRDLGANADPQSPLTGGKPAVVLYDQVPAGIGFSQHLYQVHDELVVSALEQVIACPCADGCPSCVGPGAAEGAGSKPETLALLRLLAGEPA
jgi:DEAD/DEAH box helicase domain-containing protein